VQPRRLLPGPSPDQATPRLDPHPDPSRPLPTDHARRTDLLRHEVQCYIARVASRDERRLSLGLMAYLDPKGKGDNSMPGNRRSCPGVWGVAPGGPRDMAKAGLPESQSPEGGRSAPIGKTPVTDAGPCGGFVGGCRNPLGCRSDALSGYLRRRTGRLSRARTYNTDERGIA
jgi:hypothetical protein